ncbi:MAG: hypothetical protein ACREMA_07025, partial [Longimicrobiales bacterium]
LEHRLGTLEETSAAFMVRTEELFLSVFDRFKVMEGRFDHIDAVLVDMRAQLTTLNARVDGAERRVGHVADRMEKLEKRYESIDGRLGVFADDVRQRFRVVNDRLAALAN